MIALEVFVNGQPYRTMGFGDFGMVTAEVNWFRIQKNNGSIFEDLHVHGRGLGGADQSHLLWDRQSINVGDEVIIRVVETDAYDPPSPPKLPDSPRPQRRPPTESA